MIIFGTRAKVLSSDMQPLNCANCGTNGSVHLHFVVRYFHIFWIPIFPVSKKGVTQCTHCKQVLNENQIPAAIKYEYFAAKKSAKTPVWLFTGLMLFGALIIFGMFSAGANKKQNLAYINDPKVDDVYEVKVDGGDYTLYKISKVTADSVEVLVHNYFAQKSSALSKMKRKFGNSYSETTLSFSKPQLKAMFDKSDILDVDR